jgi:antitoxin (DNA-binding transcriptional repressor) of toxin-antitoxin stability system
MSEEPVSVSTDALHAASEHARSWEQAVDWAERGETVAVLAHGRHVADVVPSGEIERLRETIDLLSDNDLLHFRVGAVPAGCQRAQLDAIVGTTSTTPNPARGPEVERGLHRGCVVPTSRSLPCWSGRGDGREPDSFAVYGREKLAVG